MSTRLASRIALTSWVLTLILMVFVLTLAAINTQSGHASGQLDAFSAPLLLFAFATVGALVAWRRPENAIGWIFCIVALLNVFGLLCQEAAVNALIANQGTLPWGRLAAWLGYWLTNLGFSLLVSFTLVLFPTGAPPSRRWRPVVWLFAGLIALAIVDLMFKPGRMSDRYPSVSNPFGIEAAADILTWFAQLSNLFFIALVVMSALSVVVRFRRSSGVERQQLKWFTSAGVLLPVAFGVDILVDVLQLPLSDLIQTVVTDLALALVPVAVGIAILRYRLYEIDVIIRRTLVYGVLTVLLVAIYAGSVVLFQELFRPFFGSSNDLAIVISTLAIAALFNPLRARSQKFIDRRFYLRRYDATKTLEAFSHSLRDEVDLNRLTEKLAGVVDETMQPAYVSLWLRQIEREVQR